MSRPSTFTNVENVVGADAIPTLSCADALRQNENPVTLFTAALLFTRGGFDRDPIVEFDARFPADAEDLRPFCVNLSKDHERFFSGFGVMPAPGKKRPVNWDQRLYCIDQRRKEECFEFLGGIAYSNPAAGIFANTFSQDLAISDPTSKTGQVLDVTVFGVMSNLFVVYLEPQLTGPPVVRKVSMSQPHLIPRAIYNAGIMGGFTGEDPLNMRDEK